MSQPAETHQMWGGRFALGPSEALDALNRSLPVDHRLWPQDVAASKGWVHALGRVRVLSPAEEAQLLEGLDRAAARLADGPAVGAPDEDVHTLVERLLYDEVGAVAGKLHTGRSRNDQVATDLRLWTLDAIDELDAGVAALGRTLVAKAKAGMDAILPGYTHGQRAPHARRASAPSDRGPSPAPDFRWTVSCSKKRSASAPCRPTRSTRPATAISSPKSCSRSR